MTTTDLDALESAWAATTQRFSSLYALGKLAYNELPALIADNRRLRAENEAMREALESAVREASLLHQNSAACAQNHYGEDFAQFGMPQWLADSAERIALARKALEGL